MIKTYVKRPVEVQAVQWTGENLDEVIEFGKGQIYIASWPMHSYKKELVFEGSNNRWVTILEDHYVIRGVDGKLDTCKPDIFEETYKEVEKTDRKTFSYTFDIGEESGLLTEE